MNGEDIKRIFEQLDERGKRYIEVVAVAELKHTREGLQKARNSILNDSAHDYALEKGKRQNEG